MKNRLLNPAKPDRTNSDEDFQNENNCVSKVGKKLSIAEFLADIELLKANKVPQNMSFGL